MKEADEGSSSTSDAETSWRFSFRRMSHFLGPGLLVSIAFIDPGNIESDLQSGALAQYKLLWVLLVSTVLGLALQAIAARLGVVTRRDMAEIAHDYYPSAPRFVLWLMIEFGIVGSDMQAVIGTATAIYMLSFGVISLWVGVLLTMVDSFFILLVDRCGARALEYVFVVLIAIMVGTFGYEFAAVQPDAVAMLKGTFVPWCDGCGQKELVQAVGIVGAVVCPYNLYYHSALLKDRRVKGACVDRSSMSRIREANFYYFVDSAIALLVSFFVNIVVLAVFAHGLFQITNAHVREHCAHKSALRPDLIFPNDSEPITADMYSGGIFLGCEFGLPALVIWGVGIWAAGTSSTMTGTQAGQFVMVGFWNIKWGLWKRMMITRAAAILPTLLVLFFVGGVEQLSTMNDLLNTLQMIILPFAVFPAVAFASDPRIMREFRLPRIAQVLALMASVGVVAINLYFVTTYVLTNLASVWWVWLCLALPVALYVLFMLYLFVTCLQSMGLLERDVFRQVSLLATAGRQIDVSAPWHGAGNAGATTCSGDRISWTSSNVPLY